MTEGFKVTDSLLSIAIGEANSGAVDVQSVEKSFFVFPTGVGIAAAFLGNIMFVTTRVISIPFLVYGVQDVYFFKVGMFVVGRRYRSGIECAKYADLP